MAQSLGKFPLASLWLAGYGQGWPACQEDDDLLNWLLDSDEVEKSLPLLKPILLRDLNLSSAIVVVFVEAEAFSLVPVSLNP